ncbi:MAG: hypothetical protein K9N09_03380 [Candidatus Cloacimonetes bacterium]|nr:hypothetical protein [Candidatus Cloacimonadota bacterium]MCF7813426.1 hypothetical protein [Candidatus Cloacimonadota bacterium]MCF7867719.1 hypothetical protein [Candidatus Cloacimonadota bacterium]MCF7883195.1 hypothetical protein [Candidatus Cloacimonadota bacterium]
MKKIVVFFVLVVIIFGCSNSRKSLLKLSDLKTEQEDWELVYADSPTDSGYQKFNHDKWLMYYLHWRPLTEERKNISTEYVRELMLSFWGPNMPFTITSDGGETEIGGHQAFYIDGTLFNEMVRTRFIVWNCLETNRQFISDCNINQTMNTSPDLFDLELEITKTVSSHGQEVSQNPNLPKLFKSEEFNISFYIPEHWNTAIFPHAGWYPDGVTKDSGSFWTLITDPEKSIEVLWQPQTELTEENLQKFISKTEETEFQQGELFSSCDSVKISNLNIESDLIIADCTQYYTHKQTVQEQEYVWNDHYIGKVFMFNRHKETYLIAATILVNTEVMGVQVNLKPSQKTIDEFIQEKLYGNIEFLQDTAS